VSFDTVRDELRFVSIRVGTPADAWKERQ